MNGIFFSVNLADTINQGFTRMVQQYADQFHVVSTWLLVWILNPVEHGLQATPPVVLLLALGILAWLGIRRLVPTIMMVALIYSIGCLGLWSKLISTVSIMVVALLVTVIIGIPMGIAMAKSKALRRVLNPVLDMMQTLPSFVYLIPVLMLFGLGRVPAVFATTVYALPPLMRLTELGLRQLPEDVLEASQAFGATPMQQLFAVELPLALPSIMAGVNQAVMMSLAMVVIASMIGAKGLGEDVLASINNLDMGQGIQAGLAIVMLAVVFDRITQAYGRSRRARLKITKANKQPIRKSSAATAEKQEAKA
ncbi:ABC transporter permease [Paraburkholderia phenazinium]|uniref:Glycine betaine/proline transport system permease protein n=1 Tax=Paraburkholderia phenazinium TaxID=60549 RepID=A0A1N6I7N6_9BURK|nr:ABC transporter permease subunit [Paraburkholderia phenazinium]SIO28010.1 glycine betaine/proline transport system permease protein [Paraburkholderia phenazinium]